MNKFTCRHSCLKITTEYQLDMSSEIYPIVSEFPRKICISYSTFLYSARHFQQLSICPLICLAGPIFLVWPLGRTFLLIFLNRAVNIISSSSYLKLQIISPLPQIIYGMQIVFFQRLYICALIGWSIIRRCWRCCTQDVSLRQFFSCTVNSNA